LTTTDNNRERLQTVSGVDIANPDALDFLLFGINEDGLAQGIIQETDFNGLPLNGNILLLLGAQSNAFDTMSTYGIGLSQLLGIADWAGAWIGMLGIPAEFPMILTGGTHQSLAFIVPVPPVRIMGNSAGIPNMPIHAPAQSAMPRSCDKPIP
jgi:hypothetical protein